MRQVVRIVLQPGLANSRRMVYMLSTTGTSISKDLLVNLSTTTLTDRGPADIAGYNERI